jgi:signal transduction histidine kinase
MSDYRLEPGLLSIFRVYVVLRFVAILAVAEFYFAQSGPALELIQIPYIALFLTNIVLLLVYLSWPWLQRKLGRTYLPIALIIASVGPIIEGRYLFLVYNAAYEARFWLIFPFLTIPLILTAWQYRFPSVVGFCLGTAICEGALIRMSPEPDTLTAMSDMGSLVVRTVFFLLMGYIVSNLMTEQRNHRQELAEANRKLVRYASTLEQLAVSQERNRLARELHDTLAHALSGLAVQLDAIATVWDPIPTKARRMLERALSITRIGLDETRRALQDLRASPLEDLGLGLAIRSLAEGVADRGNLTLELDVPEHITNLSPEVEQCYYRVAQEALENVLRHANARSISVSLWQRDGQLTMQFSDDGTGFTAASMAADDRFGLKGMQERAELIGGTLEVKSNAGQGTTIRLTSEAHS